MIQLLQPNTVIQGRYQILQTVGRGGMGAVYQARDLRLNTMVALKQSLVSGSELDPVFAREAQLLAALRHPSLPKVIDHFRDPAGQFLVMEFIDGEDLGALVDRSPGGLPVARVLAWADQLLRILEYLHGRQPPVIHRDIKPQNLKLSADDTLVLLDFGLAKGKVVAQPGAAALSVLGYTQQYAPLEQIQGQATDPRSDLFSAAGTLYHLSTGIPPVDALTRAATIIGRQPDPLVHICQLNPSVPTEAGEALMAGLALSHDERPVHAAALRAALRAVTTDTVRLHPPPASLAPVTPPSSPTPVPPPGCDLRGSTWQISFAEAGATSLATFRVGFAPNGAVEQVGSRGPHQVLGHWQQHGDQITFDIKGFSQWSGTVSAHGMRGTATTTEPRRWGWKATRVGSS